MEFRPQRRSQRQRTSKSEESSNVSVYNRFDAFEDDEEEVVPATVYSFGPESPSLEARTYLGPKLKPVKRGKLVMSKKMSDGGRALREAPFFHRKPHDFGPENPSLEERAFLGAEIPPPAPAQRAGFGGRALREAPFFHRKPHDFGPENPSLEERAFLGAEIPPPAPAQRAGFGGRALREAPRSRRRFTNGFSCV